MANPANIIDATIVAKYGLMYTLAGSQTTYLTASSNYGYHIYNLTLHNYSSSTANGTVLVGGYYLANAMTIPSKSSLILASKENPINLLYGGGSNAPGTIEAFASATNAINIHIHYDYFYDPT